MSAVYCVRNRDEYVHVGDDLTDLEAKVGEAVGYGPQPDCCGAGVLTLFADESRVFGHVVRCVTNPYLDDDAPEDYVGCGHERSLLLRDESAVTF